MINQFKNRSTLKHYSRILFVGVHPDDVEFLAGGTVAKCHDLGKKSSEIILTDGRKGFLSGLSQKQLAKKRMGEARKGARILGIGKVIFLNFRFTEGNIVCNNSNVRYLSQQIKNLNPDVVFCPAYKHTIDFWNKDHKIGGRIVEKVCEKIAKPLFFYGTFKPTILERINLSQTRRAERAIRCHESQMQIFGKTYLALRKMLGKCFGHKISSYFAEPFEKAKEL